MKKTLRKIFTFFAKPYVEKKISHDQWIDYQGIRLLVKKGVFHPMYFYSTKFLIEFLTKQDLENKKILELGAGSGLISFYCESKKNAMITASDISEIAIEGLHFNKEKLGSKIEIMQSDLFQNIPKKVFDFIIINPPYYKKKPVLVEEFAWYCGENFEYFSRLFKQIGGYFDENSIVLMVLSEDCDSESIKKIAQNNSLIFIEITSKVIFFEKNSIYKIEKLVE